MSGADLTVRVAIATGDRTLEEVMATTGLPRAQVIESMYYLIRHDFITRTRRGGYIPTRDANGVRYDTGLVRDA